MWSRIGQSRRCGLKQRQEVKTVSRKNSLQESKRHVFSVTLLFKVLSKISQQQVSETMSMYLIDEKASTAWLISQISSGQVLLLLAIFKPMLITVQSIPSSTRLSLSILNIKPKFRRQLQLKPLSLCWTCPRLTSIRLYQLSRHLLCQNQKTHAKERLQLQVAGKEW